MAGSVPGNKGKLVTLAAGAPTFTDAGEFDADDVDEDWIGVGVFSPRGRLTIRGPLAASGDVSLRLDFEEDMANARFKDLDLDLDYLI